MWQRDNKVGQNWGLQSEVGWGYKVGQKDYKVGQGLQSGAVQLYYNGIILKSEYLKVHAKKVLLGLSNYQSNF